MFEMKGKFKEALLFYYNKKQHGVGGALVYYFIGGQLRYNNFPLFIKDP